MRKLSHETRDCNRQAKGFDRKEEGMPEQTSDPRFGYNFKYRALVGFLLFAIKITVVVAFVGLLLLIVFAMLRGRTRRRRDLEDI